MLTIKYYAIGKKGAVAQRCSRSLLFVLFLLGMLWSGTVAAQRQRCRDKVFIQNGSVLTGKIISWQPGDTLTIETWSGIRMKVPDMVVHHVEQQCPALKAGAGLDEALPYSFREKGWYHFTRGSVLGSIGDVDFALQHSSGYKFNRFLGVGLGVGVDNLSYQRNETVPTYPVFAEIRGFIHPKRLSAFYALGGGYAFTKGAPESPNNNVWWAISETWEGSWIAQAQLGYRCGNHIMVYGGLRLQRKTRYWEGRDVYGTDRILHKRLELGVGILL